MVRHWSKGAGPRSPQRHVVAVAAVAAVAAAGPTAGRAEGRSSCTRRTFLVVVAVVVTLQV